MADQQPKPRTIKRHSTPIVVRPAKTVPISDEDYQLAVHALAVMIESWLDEQKNNPTE